MTISPASATGQRDWKAQDAALKGKKVEWRNPKDTEKVAQVHMQVIQIVLDTIADL